MLVVIIVNRHLIKLQLFNYFKNVPFNAQMAESIYGNQIRVSSIVYCGQGFLYCTMDEQEGQNQPIHCIGVQADGGGGGWGGGGLQLYYMIKLFFQVKV